MATWLRDAGFGVEAQALLEPDSQAPGGMILARRPGATAPDDAAPTASTTAAR